MTLQELINAVEEEHDYTLYENELCFYEKIDEEKAYIIKINSLGLFEDKLLLAPKCPLCKD